MKLNCTALVLLVLGAACAAQAGDKPPAYASIRFEEDWSSYDPADGGVLFAPLKHVPLSENVWASFGGSVRVRYENFQGFGFDDSVDDDYMPFRTMLHADLHLGDHVRLFVEGRFCDVNDRDLPGGRREANDYDRGDLLNTFLEFNFPIGSTDATLRLGRQMIALGKERLISPQNWSNNRRVYEGARFHVADEDKTWELDLIAASPVLVDGDSLSWNPVDDDRRFAIIQYARRSGANMAHLAEVYLLRQWRDAPGLSREDLYMVGGRVGGPVSKGFSYDVEFGYQFGEQKLASVYADELRDIAALFSTVELAYTSNEGLRPYAILGLDYASGDSNASDGKVGTYSQFNQQTHSFFGFIDVLGRQNIVDARMTLGFWPVEKRVRLQADFHAFWRANAGDAMYGTGGTPARVQTFVTPGGRTVTADEREIGQEIDFTLQYRPHPTTTFLVGYSHFWAGPFLAQTGAHDDTDFTYAQVEFFF